jgi:D-alanine-D-alanine ligase-like ATP-grasp enzyme
MPLTPHRPLAVYYEHPDWFRPLFAELERQGVPYGRLHVTEHAYDPGDWALPYGLVFNRMSPSAYLRDQTSALFYTLHMLAHLEQTGVRVINGAQAYRHELSKALQLTLLKALGLPFPAARVIHDARQAAAAARDLRFPVVVKPNVGGSGAGIRRFETPAELAEAAGTGALDLGPDHTALVQDAIPAQDGCITRVEVLGGRYLYAIRVYSPGDTFNLCPADACRTTDGGALVRAACPADAPDLGLRVEAATPPPEVVAAVERIMRAAGIDVGGVEYLIDARDGRLYYYDVNALSNFVADAPRVVGFDPFARLVEYLVREAA